MTTLSVLGFASAAIGAQSAASATKTPSIRPRIGGETDPKKADRLHTQALPGRGNDIPLFSSKDAPELNHFPSSQGVANSANPSRTLFARLAACSGIALPRSNQLRRARRCVELYTFKKWKDRDKGRLSQTDHLRRNGRNLDKISAKSRPSR
jgi:hypothetical protein